MGSYLIRRFGLMLLTLFGISMIIFGLLRIVPGNIVDILFDSAGMVNPAEKLKIEKELGLDKPIPLQYLAWVGGMAQGGPPLAPVGVETTKLPTTKAATNTAPVRRLTRIFPPRLCLIRAPQLGPGGL